MWCLETIKAVNQKLAEGKNVHDAYAECGISVPTREGAEALIRARAKERDEEGIIPCGMRKPLPLKVVA